MTTIARRPSSPAYRGARELAESVAAAATTSEWGLGVAMDFVYRSSPEATPRVKPDNPSLRDELRREDEGAAASK